MKNFTNNFKQFTSRLSARWLIMALMLLIGTSSAWAGGSASGPAGVYLEVDGTASWYNIHYTDWGYNPCSGWDFKNATKIGQGDDEVKDFGTVTSFKLKGFGIIGWCDGTDWVSGQLRYQVNSNSQQYYKVCNYGDCNSGRYSDHEVCKSNNDRVVGYKDSNIDLLTGLTPGEHTIKFKAYGQNLWNNNGSCGDFNSVDHSEKSATFTVPGYSTTTDSHDFGEVDLGSPETQTIDLTHYGSDNTASVSITGTNKSEFTATVTKNGDNKQTLTVTFNPTTEDSNKTATITVTDAYDKTYTLEVTGTGKQSCQDPTSVSITRSDAPSTANICQGSTIDLTANVDGGSGDITYSWTKVSGTDWSVSANSDKQTCTVTAGTGEAEFQITATRCGTDITNTITLTADAKPAITLNAAPTICPGDEVTFANYVKNTSIGTVTWHTDPNCNTAAITSATPNATTTYYAKATNGVCSTPATASLKVTVKPTPTKPAITLIPEGGKIVKGENATLTVTAQDDVTFTLYRDGASTGKTETPFTISEEGTYHVVGINSCDVSSPESEKKTITICTPNATLISATYNQETDKIDLRGNLTETCGKNLWYGFLWKVKNEDWNTNNTISGTGGGNNNTSTNNTAFNQSWADAVMGTTYVFTAYALDASSGNPSTYVWYYDETGIEVSKCITITEPDITAAPICAGSTAVLTLNNRQNGVTYTLQDGIDGTPIFADDEEYTTPTLNTNTTYTISATSANSCVANQEETTEVTVTVKELPAAPALTYQSNSVCQANETVNLNELAIPTGNVNWYDGSSLIADANVSIATYGTFTYVAKAVSNGCESEQGTEFELTVIQQPTISVSPSTTDATCYQMVTLTANTGNTVEGALVEWYEGETLKGTGNTYTFTKETASPATTITAKVRNYTTCDYVTADATVSFTAHEVCSTNSYVQGKIAYMTIGDNTFGKGVSGAWYAAYFYKGNTNKWVKMTDEDNDGTWACEIPEGYTHVIFCYMKPGQTAMNWGNKNNQTAGDNKVSIPTTAQKCIVTGNGNHKWEDLESGKSFKTIALNGNGKWNVGGASIFAHPWSMSNPNTDGWSRMIPGINAGEYLVDVYADYTDIMFERRDPSGNKYDGGADKHKTADLVLDTYGNNFVITKAYQQDYPDAKADGEWQWKWYANSYTLGLSTKASVADGSTTINATGAFYRTDCAPGLEFSFKYIKAENEPTENDWESAKAQYVGNRPIAVGEEFTMNIDAAGGGIYWVRSCGRYNNGTYTYGNVVRVIVQGCTAGYEFEVANTSAVVQACGESRVLPTIEFLSNTEVAGETFTYQWKNEDDSDATNLSAMNIATPTFNGKSSQNYKVIVAKMVGGQLKCSKTATYQVAYDDNSPKAIINDGAETITAEINEQLVLQGAAHYTESFTWTVKENEVDVTSTMLSDASILNPTFNTKEAGTYVVTLTAAGNQYCVAHTATATVKVNAPTEDCASSDIEIEYDFSNGVPSFFNDANNVYYTYKTKNGDCVYTSLDNNNKLWKDNASFTINNLQESDFPITLYIVAGSKLHIGNVEARGYAEYTLNYEDHLGKKVICSATGGNSDIDTNVTSEICIGNDAKRKLKEAKATMEVTNISGSTSAPTISSPKAVVNDDTKKATLSAYLAKTGCSAITNYGFQYIMSDTEPSESDWTNSSKTTTQDFTNNIVIGKTFKWETTDVLEQGKYWFRAYAKNAAVKISYTSPISFEIIADGPYPVFIDAVQDHESEAALYITNDGYVEVKIYNKGKDDDDDVLEGSYKLIIENQNQNILFTPLIKNTPIEHQSSVTFTSKDKVANLDHYNITATLTYKGRKDTRNISKCTPIKAAQDLDNNGLRDTIYYTIDAAAVTDKCMLVFPTVYEAVEHLKKSSEAEEDYQYTKKIGNGYILQQPVVMQVAYSTNRYKGNISVNTTGGGDKVSATIIPIININNDDDNGNCQGGAKYNIDNGNSDDVKYYSLTIRALNPNARPALQHLAIRDSRYITLDNLNLVASSTIKDNALDIDCNNNSWVGNVRGKFKNTYVTVKNCNITSKGFTCVHVSAVDQIHFLNNEITAELDDDDVDDDNVRCWGASVKFIRSENLSFIRNNFMGTHATSIWLQEVKGALFMNNVLWNNNKIEKDIFAMFRIVHQTGDYHPKNIGIYYNTLFLDNNGERSASPKFNFLTLNSDDDSNNDDAIAHDGTFDTETIEFMYNNCYSYDTRTPGRPDNPFKGREAWEGLCYNNFWSAKSGADFSFNGCSTIHNVNVEDNVCTTGATSPHSLVISGDGLNLGIKPATTLAVQLGANLLMSDRNRSNVRPESVTDDDLENYKGWTLGAYQQTEPEEVSTIIWQGEAGTDWDNRNNWIDADTKRVLTCTHELASNLRVIIPAPHSEKYQVPGEEGVVNYPVIPVFNTRNTTLYGSELVNAGQKVGGANSGKFAEVIEIEYGGSLQGVENLVDRYVEAKTNFTAGRDQWTLVGTVVKPWTDGTKQSTRNIKSGDYFIEKQTPHVYMHYAYMDGNTAKWSEPFTSKEESLEVTDVMAINLPNQYGEYKLTSQDYYTYSPDKDPEKLNDNVVPKNYEFVGEFVNEASLPSITGLKENEPVLLNNSYPCNIDPEKLQNGQGTVWMYDYKGGSFSLTSDDDVLIKPQHGFIFKPTGETYQVTKEMLVSGDTKSRSAEAEMPIFSLNLFNANSTEGEYSRVIVKYDELGDNGPVDLDLEKMFAENASTPELYIVMYDGKYQRVHVNSKEIVIPLGIRLMTSMNVSFQKFKAEGFDKVTLVDVVANKEYNLLSGKEVVTEKLLAGDIEGRFFLNLKETEEDDDIEGDDNVSTEIEEDSAEQSINILVEGENTVKVITNGVQLENIYVSDMAGRTVGYKASGYSAEIELPVAQGVYMVNVIGDTASRTEKVILK